MSESSSKHRNLQHRLSPDIQQRAALHLGADGAEAGVLVLEMRQRDMQELFGKIFGVPTKSSNNEWLRSKLLQAVGLPPRWRPAPTPPPAPPSKLLPGEYSRFGRRLRTTFVPALALEAEDSGEETDTEMEVEGRRPAAKRARTARSPGSARSAGSVRSGSRSPFRGGTCAASPTSSAAGMVAASVASCSAAAILSLQARAAAAVASVPASHAQPMLLPSVSAMGAALPVLAPQVLPTAQLPGRGQPTEQGQGGGAVPPAPQVPVAPTADAPQQRAALVLRSVSMPVRGDAPARGQALAALLSIPVQPPASPRPFNSMQVQLPSLVKLPSFGAHGAHQPSCSLSAQLHLLYSDWEEGRLSFGPM